MKNAEIKIGRREFKVISECFDEILQNLSDLSEDYGNMFTFNCEDPDRDVTKVLEFLDKAYACCECANIVREHYHNLIKMVTILSNSYQE